MDNNIDLSADKNGHIFNCFMVIYVNVSNKFF